jgi:hypothetical protein
MKVFILVIASVCCAFAQRDITVLGVAAVTEASMGQFKTGYWPQHYGLFDVAQSSASGAGPSVEYRHWWGKNGAALTYSSTPTDSKLTSPQWGVVQWGIRRHEFNLAWVRQFRSESRISPYTKAGAGEILLNGGNASGLDHQFEIVLETGSDTRLSRRLALRSGFALHLLRASNFSDDTYQGARTSMLEPRFGIVWTLDNPMKGRR